jgi:hypothetical protein
VAELVWSGRAQSVLGNHELNVMLGERKHGNGWFFGDGEETLDRSGRKASSVPADERTRAFALGFFSRLPLVLERSDLRVVHACWQADMAAFARQEKSVLRLYEQHRTRLQALTAWQKIHDDVECGLVFQNHNPVKVLTSGLEQRADEPYEAAGKLRHEERMEWWQHYNDDAWCVFGHYGRVLLDGEKGRCSLFDRDRWYESLGNGRALCIDYGIAKRWKERLSGQRPGRFVTRLTALRFPEMQMWFDNGDVEAIRTPGTL